MRQLWPSGAGRGIVQSGRFRRGGATAESARKEATIRLNRLPLEGVRGVLADEAERALDAALAGPLPEIAGRALVEHHVLDRVSAAMREAGDGKELERLAEEVLREPAIRRAVAELVASTEVRQALAESMRGTGEDAGASARAKTRAADDRVEARAHRLLRRSEPALPGYGGVATRGIALAADALLAQAAYLVGAASVALVLGLAGGLAPGWSTGTAAGAGWLLVVTAYFAGFWSVTGQTPGQRLLRLRVVTASGERASPSRALVRVAGLILAIVPLCAGFLPALVDRRRRALPDYLAGTVVVYESSR
jgi:uncharacterized RDD family membrane protein YckC